MATMRCEYCWQGFEAELPDRCPQCREPSAERQQLEATNAALLEALEENVEGIEWLADMFDVPIECKSVNLCGHRHCENIGCLRGKIERGRAIIAAARGE